MSFWSHSHSPSREVRGSQAVKWRDRKVCLIENSTSPAHSAQHTWEIIFYYIDFGPFWAQHIYMRLSDVPHIHQKRTISTYFGRSTTFSCSVSFQLFFFIRFFRLHSIHQFNFACSISMRYPRFKIRHKSFSFIYTKNLLLCFFFLFFSAILLFFANAEF